jgi:hypothetical protein
MKIWLINVIYPSFVYKGSFLLHLIMDVKLYYEDVLDNGECSFVNI